MTWLKSFILIIVSAQLAAGCAKSTSGTASNSKPESHAEFEICFNSQASPILPDETNHLSDGETVSEVLELTKGLEEPCGDIHVSSTLPDTDVATALSLVAPNNAGRVTKVTVKWVSKLRARVTLYRVGKKKMTKTLTAIPPWYDTPDLKLKLKLVHLDQRLAAQVQSWNYDLYQLSQRADAKFVDREIMDDSRFLISKIFDEFDTNAKTVRAVVDPDGKVQAVAAFTYGDKNRCLDVEYLVTRPGNLLLSFEQRNRVGGSASSLLRETFREHVSRKGRKCMTLTPFDNAISPYLKMGFYKYQVGRDVRMILKDAAADKFLATH